MSLQPAIDLLIRQACREETDTYTLAVAVLKAAEKVDKERAIKVLATLLHIYVSSEKIIFGLEKDLEDGVVKEIRDLLEALPEKEE